MSDHVFLTASPLSEETFAPFGEIIAELNKADDLNRRTCAQPAAQSWAD